MQNLRDWVILFTFPLITKIMMFCTVWFAMNKPMSTFIPIMILVYGVALGATYLHMRMGYLLRHCQRGLAIYADRKNWTEGNGWEVAYNILRGHWVPKRNETDGNFKFKVETDETR